ncbi:Tc toxin subunit A [Pseudomonas sp. TMB3-21]
MNTSDERPVNQLAKAVLGEQRVTQVGSFTEYLEQNPSVFELVKLGTGGLQKLGLSRVEAKAMMGRGNALASYMARVFRERNLHGMPTRHNARASVPLPTYMDLINPNTEGSAPAGSIENSASTTAYLVTLREWVRDRIVPQADLKRSVSLQVRRPDVDNLWIDEMAVNRQQSRLEIANAVLEAQINSKLPEGIHDVKTYLRTCRFHHGLPYDHDWESIAYVVATVLKEGSLGDVLRGVDSDYPHFKNRGGRGRRADAALQLSSGIGPLKLSLLLEAPYFSSIESPENVPLRRVDPRTRLVDPTPQASAESFYKDNFGQHAANLDDLRKLGNFTEATRLDQRSVDALLGRGAFTPKLSANAPAIGDPEDLLTGVTAGATYIHAGEQPAIEVKRNADLNAFELHHVGEAGFTQFASRMDRINRKCRLDRLLGKPSHQVDQLLMAAMHAESRGTGKTDIWITVNTLRCLGLFQELSSAYECEMEEFAALIDVLSVYGQDGQLSHFDRVYNRQAMYDEPLRIDDGEFAIMPSTAADQQTVHQICSALKINFETYRYLATVIAKACGLNTHLSRSLKVLSSFWRLVKVARLVELTPIESTALLQTLSNGDGLVAQLAAEPAVSGRGAGDGADALSAIRALTTCVEWCRANDLPVLWLVQHTAPVLVPTVWSELQEQYLRQLRSQVQPMLLTAAALVEAGAPLRGDNEAIVDWLAKLSKLVDAEGLVIGRHDQTEADYLKEVDTAIGKVVVEVLDESTDEERERVHSLVRAVLLRRRDEQRVAVQESCAVYLELDSSLAAQVLVWSQGHPYDFLSKAMSQQPGSLALAQHKSGDPDPFLKMLVELERRGRIVKKLELSAQMLSTLVTGEQYQWFSLESAHEISIQTMYYLAFYQRMIKLARQPEEKMLAYLRQVNELPEELAPDALSLIRDAATDKLATFFGCGIRHVLQCAQHIGSGTGDTQRPILSSLAHLDLLSRTLEFARKGMDATSALTLGALNPLDLQPIYANAAQNALESLARFKNLSTSQDSAEVGQSITTRCVVDNPRLIANVGREVAEFECTLLDFYGEPLKGVPVYWSTDLGALLTPETLTDERGRAKASLQAGARIGTAHVVFNLPLHEPIYAPSVVIGCDEATLFFPSELMSPLPESPVLAGRLWEQEVSAVLLDRYGNKGVQRQVIWSTTCGEIRPSETFTDKDGIARAWYSSLSVGNAEVMISDMESHASATFNGTIQFCDKPRIVDVPHATGVVMINRPVTMRCQVVGLDGAAVAGKVVTWWTSADPVKTPQSSDEEGFSQVNITPVEAGNLTVFAQLGGDPVTEVTLWVVSTAVITKYSEPVRFSMVGARPTLQWIDVMESDATDARPIANYPVSWTLNTVPVETISIATDAYGRSVYPFNPSTAGNFKVIAQLGHSSTEQAFDLTVTPAFEWNVQLISDPGTAHESSETIVPGTGEFSLLRNGHYRLEITPGLAASLEGSQGALGWSCDYSTQKLGVLFDPPLATRFTFTDQPYAVDIRTHDIRNGRFQISLVCDRLNEAMIIGGSLDKRPPTRRDLSKP